MSLWVNISVCIWPHPESTWATVDFWKRNRPPYLPSPLFQPVGSTRRWRKWITGKINFSSKRKISKLRYRRLKIQRRTLNNRVWWSAIKEKVSHVALFHWSRFTCAKRCQISLLQGLLHFAILILVIGEYGHPPIICPFISLKRPSQWRLWAKFPRGETEASWDNHWIIFLLRISPPWAFFWISSVHHGGIWSS